MYYGKNRVALDPYRPGRFSDGFPQKSVGYHEVLPQKNPRFTEDYIQKPSRFSADERVIFERLWRGALCQTFGGRMPVRQKKTCCCHCQYGTTVGNNGTNVIPLQYHLQTVPRKTMKSVVR